MLIKFEDIYNATLQELDIKRSAFERTGKSRIAPFVKARQMICYIAIEAGYTALDIAKRLSITRVSVRYHVQKAKEHIQYEPDYAKDMRGILLALKFSYRKYSEKGWLVRDKEEDGGYLYLTIGEKPQKDLITNMWLVENGAMFDAPKEAFPQITWESEPQECEMTITLK